MGESHDTTIFAHLSKDSCFYSGKCNKYICATNKQPKCKKKTWKWEIFIRNIFLVLGQDIINDLLLA